MNQRNFTNILVLLAILMLAFALRIIGLNWDDHSHLHPDERFLTGMASQIGRAERLTDTAWERCNGKGAYDYFNTTCSSYNPNNVDDGSYAYGTLPLFIVRISADLVVDVTGDDEWGKYDRIHFVGRTVNALADTLTTLFIFIIGWRLFSPRHGLIAAFFYACAVLPIQLSHYWTVDILANLFFVIALYALIEISKNGQPWWYGLFGIAFGMAVASRINIAPFALMLPVAVFIYLRKISHESFLANWLHRIWVAGLLILLASVLSLASFRSDPWQIGAWVVVILTILAGIFGNRKLTSWLYRAWAAILLAVLAGVLSFVTFRVFQPYAFLATEFSDWDGMNPKWLDDISYVSSLSSDPSDGWPPSNQWFGRVKYIYPWMNLVMWGLGTPLGIAATLAVAWAIYQQISSKRLSAPVGIFTVWIVIYFAWQGGLHQMTMRYYLPLYGILCLMAAWALLWLNWPLRKYITAGILISTLLWAFAFTRIYRQPLTRLEASEWIADNLLATVTFQGEDGNLYPAGLSGEGLRYPLTTVTNGETYISDGFLVDMFTTLTGFEMVFADDIPSTVNVRLLDEEDPYAERPLARFTLQTDGKKVAHYEFAPGEIPDLPEGTYNWHFDVNWQGEQPFRYVIPTYQWFDRESENNNTPITFLSPYEPVRFAALHRGNGLQIGTDIPHDIIGFYLPHLVGDVTDLTLRIRENDIIARPADSTREEHVLGAQWYYALDEPVELPAGDAFIHTEQPLYIAGTVIATEGAWDDHVPWGFCTRDDYPHLIRFIEYCDRLEPFEAGYYPWLELGMAETDTASKNLLMLDILYKADYLTISSNRFYDALPRYPVNAPPPRIENRFVMSTQFYKDLFSGKLNYEVVRTFASFPGFLGLDFRDQVLPTASVPNWMNEFEAEEAFTVYDHPTVFIFKNEGFDVQDFSSELVKPDTRNRINLDDYKSTFTPSQERTTPADVRQTLLLWFIGFFALGWIAYPMTFLLFPALPLRGFGIGRALGWLMLAFVPWWLTAASGGPFWTRTALWGFTALFTAVNLTLFYRYRSEILPHIRQHFRKFLAYELLFLVAFAFAVYLRAVNPDLWHTDRGGEKPMDFAYLNATLRTSDFPPPNPWLAGYEMNYYYFGFVLAALPIKLGNFAPEIGFNLVLATLYPLVTVNIFTLACTLLSRAEKIVPRLRLLMAGLGTAFVVLAGNLGALSLMLNPEENMHAHRFYWYPTRIIAESKNHLEAGDPITEVPLFSFLFGDPHAHVYTLLPVTLYLLALWLLVTQKKWIYGLLVGMISGIIFMSNIWDVVLYVPLGVLAMWWATREPRRFIQLAIVVAAGGIFTIAPYYLEFTVGADRGIQAWEGETSMFEPFMLTWGIPLGVVAVWLLYRLKAVLVPEADTPVELGILLIAGAFLYFVPGDLQRASALCAMLSIVGLALVYFDDRRLRPIHFFSSLIFAILLATEHYVIKGDVGRLNTVFKITFQLWVWFGLLIAVILYTMWTSYRMRFQVILCIVLISLGFLYPLKAIPGRKADSESGALTLDGYKFTDTLTLRYNGWKIHTYRDNALTRYMRENIDGFPIIAEWYTQEYIWNSRVSVQTGFPAVVGWGNHMRQQYQHLGPMVDERINDMRLFYTTRDINDIRTIIRKYDIEYIVLGELERSIAEPETLDAFYTMYHNGELSLVYDAPFTQLFKVEKLQEENPS